MQDIPTDSPDSQIEAAAAQPAVETTAPPAPAATASPWGLLLAFSLLGTLCQTGQALVPVLRQVFGQRLPYDPKALAFSEAGLHYGFAFGCIVAIALAGRLRVRTAFTISAILLVTGGAALVGAVTQAQALPVACAAFAIASGFIQPTAFAALIRIHSPKTWGLSAGIMAMFSGVIGAVVAYETQLFAARQDGLTLLLKTTGGIVAVVTVLGWLLGRWVSGHDAETPENPPLFSNGLALPGIVTAAAALYFVTLYQNFLYSKNVADTAGFRTSNQFESFGTVLVVAGLLRTLGGGLLSDLAGRFSARSRLVLLAVPLALCAATGSMAAAGKAPAFVLAVFLISIGLAQGVIPGAIAAVVAPRALAVWFGAALLTGPVVNELAFWARLPGGYAPLPALAAALLLVFALRAPDSPPASQEAEAPAA